MRKILLTISLFAFTCIANAQLFVKDGSYVFMTNQYMTVMQDVNLNNTGQFYLRNTAQLLQKGVGNSLNTGTGKLSVFQEGTVNNFQFNYWCSPVGNGAAGNPFGIALLNRPTGLISSTAAEILPGTNLNGTATGGTSGTMQIASYWIWKFVSLSSDYANWQPVGNAQTINPGEGFTMKGTSGTDVLVADADGVTNKTGLQQRYDFRGRPNDGNVSVAISNGNLTLVGNPYPSAINLNMYLIEHTGRQYDPNTGVVSAGVNPDVIDGSAYFWEHSKSTTSHNMDTYVGGYGTYVANGVNVATPGTWTAATWATYDGAGNQVSTGATTGSSFKRQFCPIGQGFMVKGIASGTSIMKNKYRAFVRENNNVIDGSTFERNTNTNLNTTTTKSWDDIPNMADLDYTQISRLPVPQIKLLTILNNEFSTEVAMAFNPNTTDNYDIGYDGISPDSNGDNLVYFGQNNYDKKCVITTLPFDIEKRIPIAFKCAAQSTFKVKVSEIINFTDSENVYIYDKETGVYHDIKNGEFNSSLPAGDNNTRFEVTFKKLDVLPNELNILVADSFEVFQNNKNSMLTIANSLGRDVLNCEVYDISGKLVINKKNLGTNNLIELPTGSLSDGVYIVRLNAADNIFVEKKVIVGK
jgi:hypothetical protein